MFDELVGLTLLGKERNTDGTLLIFYTTVGYYVYVAEADCCSDSWVESVSEHDWAIRDAVVIEVREKHVRESGTRQQEDKVAFVTLVTSKGMWDLEFRNSSNGYYGGRMRLSSAPESALDSEAREDALVPMFGALKGRTLRGVTIERGGDVLTFATDRGDYAYVIEEDCAGESWVESVSENIVAVTDALVVAVREKYWWEPGTIQERDKVSFVSLVTTGGHFDIEFRSSSNGFYAGRMRLVHVRGRDD